jgi:hypothetical protein
MSASLSAIENLHNLYRILAGGNHVRAITHGALS